MPLVKIKQRFQVTIPSSIRGMIPLDVGDMLEATVNNDGILLKPQVVFDRKKTVSELKKAFAAINKKSPLADRTDDEIMAEAIKIVKEVRSERKSKKT